MMRRIGAGLALRLAAVALAAGSAVLAPSAVAHDSAAEFAPPRTDMLLTRTLRRALPDGEEVVARRSYAVRFVSDGQGFRIDGRLIDVAVETPPSLQALAEIERKRPDTGMFPIRLDAAGMIIGGEPPAAGEASEKAAAIAAGQIGASGLVAIDMLQAQAFISQMRKRRAASLWPADLFHPLAIRRSETKTVALPDGQSGQVVIETVAQTAGSSGLLASFERTVTTDLQGDKRVTRELWTLAPAAPNSAR